MKTRQLMIAVISLVALAGSAQAAVLATGPARANVAGATLYCDIANIGNSIGSVTIDIAKYDGTVDQTGSFTLASGEGQSVFTNGQGAYCRFTVAGSAKNFREVAVYTTGGDYHMAIEAR